MNRKEREGILKYSKKFIVSLHIVRDKIIKKYMNQSQIISTAVNKIRIGLLGSDRIGSDCGSDRTGNSP